MALPAGCKAAEAAVAGIVGLSAVMATLAEEQLLSSSDALPSMPKCSNGTSHRAVSDTAAAFEAGRCPAEGATAIATRIDSRLANAETSQSR